MREMIMGENYERNITLIRSDISRFSRGTVSTPRRNELQGVARSVLCHPIEMASDINPGSIVDLASCSRLFRQIPLQTVAI